MNVKLRNNNIVILAEAHNPTLVSDKFLKDTGIIENIEDIDRNKSVITPLFVQIITKDKTTLQLDANRLFISNSEGEDPYKKAINYIKSLPFIKCTGIGINFEYEIKDYDFKEFFSKIKKVHKGLEGEVISFNIKINNSDNKKTNISILYIDNRCAHINFNFDYKFNVVQFKDIKLDPVREWELNKKDSNQKINKICE